MPRGSRTDGDREDATGVLGALVRRLFILETIGRLLGERLLGDLPYEARSGDFKAAEATIRRNTALGCRSAKLSAGK